MGIDFQTINSANATYNAPKFDPKKKIVNQGKPLFSYMNAGLRIPSDGTTIAYMNANNSNSGNGFGNNNGSNNSGSKGGSVSFYA